MASLKMSIVLLYSSYACCFFNSFGINWIRICSIEFIEMCSVKLSHGHFVYVLWCDMAFEITYTIEQWQRFINTFTQIISYHIISFLFLFFFHFTQVWLLNKFNNSSLRFNLSELTKRPKKCCYLCIYTDTKPQFNV